MDVQIAEVKLISMTGYSSQWKVLPEDIITVDGQAFVRMKPWCAALQKMVTENNDLIQYHKHFTITTCVGFQTMLQLRTKATAEANIISKSSSCLFEAAPKAAKMPRRSLDKVKQERAAERASVEININVDGQDHAILVLQHIHPTDAMYVLCDPVTLGFIIKFIRDEGVTEPKQSLPTGCRLQKSGKVLAVHKDSTGKQKYKHVNDVESAVQWKAIMESGGEVDADDGTEEDEDDETDQK